MTKEQIRTAAMELAPAEREALAEELLLSVSELERHAIESAWLAEARRRDAAFIRRETGAKPVDAVITRLTGQVRS